MCRIHAALPSAKTSQRNDRFDFSSYASVSHSAAFQLAKLACKAQLGTFCVPPRTSGTFPNDADNGVRYPSLAAALAINSSPTPTMTIPMARAMRSPFGASRSAVIAAVTRAITRRSMTPTTRRIAVKAAQP
jgi:hypothetical protein